jgi:hypothetical protein
MLMEERGLDPDPDKIPVGYEDLSYDAQLCLNIYGRLGNRVYGDVGFVGKDYTNLPILIKFHEIVNTDFLLEMLNIIDEYNVDKSQKAMKKEMDKIKNSK